MCNKCANSESMKGGNEA